MADSNRAAFLCIDPADARFLRPLTEALRGCGVTEVRTEGLTRPGELFLLAVSDRILLSDGRPLEAALERARELGLTILPLCLVPLDLLWLDRDFPGLGPWIDPWSRELEEALR